MQFKSGGGGGMQTSGYEASQPGRVVGVGVEVGRVIGVGVEVGRVVGVGVEVGRVVGVGVDDGLGAGARVGAPVGVEVGSADGCGTGGIVPAALLSTSGRYSPDVSCASAPACSSIASTSTPSNRRYMKIPC